MTEKSTSSLKYPSMTAAFPVVTLTFSNSQLVIRTSIEREAENLRSGEERVSVPEVVD